MATWHQNKAGLTGLYEPHPTGWKIVHDRHGQMASSIVLGSAEEAAKYCLAQPDGILIPPRTVTDKVEEKTHLTPRQRRVFG